MVADKPRQLTDARRRMEKQLSCTIPLFLKSLVAILLVACGDSAATGGSGGGERDGGGGSGAGTDGGAPPSNGGSDAGGGGEGGAPPAPTVAFVYVGTAEGSIERYTLDRSNGALSPLGTVDVGGHPSFLAPRPNHQNLYAVDESNNEVIAFAIDPSTGDLTELGRASSEGNGPAHVSVDRSGAWVFVANYGSGHVAVLPILEDGSVGEAVDVELAGANAHSIFADPSNALVFVPCLGDDIVARYFFDEATGQLDELSPPASLPAGTGPRHLDFGPQSKVYVIGEKGDTLTTFSLGDAGGLVSDGSVSTLPGGSPSPDNHCADVHVHPSRNFVYGSNRGDDSIAIFTLDDAGTATPAGHVSTGGAWPRNFGIDPDGGILLVANQQSDGIVTFRIDEATGALTQLQTTATGDGPAWVGVVEQVR